MTRGLQPLCAPFRERKGAPSFQVADEAGGNLFRKAACRQECAGQMSRLSVRVRVKVGIEKKRCLLAAAVVEEVCRLLQKLQQQAPIGTRRGIRAAASPGTPTRGSSGGGCQ